MFRHNARLRKRRPSSPPVFRRGGEKPPPLPKWEGRREGRREASSSPPVFGRGSRDAQVEQARAGERAGVERGGAGGGPGPAPPARAGQRAGVERGAFYWRAGTPPFPPPLPFLRAGAGRPALPRTRPPRRGPTPGRDRCQSRGMNLRGWQ